MQMVDNDTKLSYVYTAYVDDRETPDVKSSWLPVVRVFASIRRTENVTGQWRCVFCDDRFSHPVESVVVGWTDLDKSDSSSE